MSDVALKRFMCLGRGFLYDEKLGLPEHGIPPGTRCVDIPDDWVRPDCGIPKSGFEMVAIPYATKPPDNRRAISAGSRFAGPTSTLPRVGAIPLTPVWHAIYPFFGGEPVASHRNVRLRIDRWIAKTTGLLSEVVIGERLEPPLVSYGAGERWRELTGSSGYFSLGFKWLTSSLPITR